MVKRTGPLLGTSTMAGLLHGDDISAGGIRMRGSRLPSKACIIDGFTTPATTIRPFVFGLLKLTGALPLLRTIGQT